MQTCTCAPERINGPGYIDDDGPDRACPLHGEHASRPDLPHAGEGDPRWPMCNERAPTPPAPAEGAKPTPATKCGVGAPVSGFTFCQLAYGHRGLHHFEPLPAAAPPAPGAMFADACLPVGYDDLADLHRASMAAARAEVAAKDAEIGRRTAERVEVARCLWSDDEIEDCDVRSLIDQAQSTRRLANRTIVAQAERDAALAEVEALKGEVGRLKALQLAVDNDIDAAADFEAEKYATATAERDEARAALDFMNRPGFSEDAFMHLPDGTTLVGHISRNPDRQWVTREGSDEVVAYRGVGSLPTKVDDRETLREALIVAHGLAVRKGFRPDHPIVLELLERERKLPEAHIV